MDGRKGSLILTSVLILIDALTWLVLGVVIGIGLHPAIPEGDLARWGMSILALLTSVALVGLYSLAVRRVRFAYCLLLLLLAVIAVLTILDDFGLPDLVVLILHVAAFMFLIKDRGFYAQRKRSAAEGSSPIG
jgi:hypothetical protein